MLLAEDLLLLVTDDASGRLSAPADRVAAGLGGANLAELTFRNQVDLTGQQDPGRPGRIIVRDRPRPVTRSWMRRCRPSPPTRAKGPPR